MDDDCRNQAEPNFVHTIQNMNTGPSSPLKDVRTPRRDIFAHLADIQVQRADILRLGNHIREAWPSVKFIDGSVEDNGRIYFDIQIDPYSDAEVVRHKPLVKWMTNNIPGCKDIRMHFYRPLDQDRIRTSIPIYRFDQPEQRIGSPTSVPFSRS